MKRRIRKLEEIIGYSFENKDLLVTALMHSSYANEKQLPKIQCNERLEFLGDAVLELLSSQFLFESDENMPEGQLTKLRASAVCESSLAYCARGINLGDFLLLGKGEEVTGGRERDSVTSDALEALIGAIYLDGGFASAKEFVYTHVLNDLEHKKLFFDSKTILQELVQGTSDKKVTYSLLKEEGPDHSKTFTTEVLIGDVCFGTGTGKTKKAAEQDAAYHAILKLRKE